MKPTPRKHKRICEPERNGVNHILKNFFGTVYKFSSSNHQFKCLKNDLNLNSIPEGLKEEFNSKEERYSYKSRHINNEIKESINYRVIKEKENYFLLTSIPFKKKEKEDDCSWLLILNYFKITEQNASIEKIVSHQKRTEYAELYNKLSKREVQILKRIGQGMEFKAVAKALNIAYNTVVTHRKRLFKKLNTNKSAELAVWAEKLGILSVV